MHPTEYRILNLFKSESGREIPTSEIVKAAFAETQDSINTNLSSNDPVNKREGKFKKAQLHRNCLYHLNKLVNDNILKVSAIRNRGEKYFVLQVPPDELSLDMNSRKIIISQTTEPVTQTTLYEKKNIVRRFDEHTWINRLNAVLIEGTFFDGINRLYAVIQGIYLNVNDAIAINDFQHLIEQSSMDQLIDILKNIDADAKDKSKIITLIFNLFAIGDSEKHQRFFERFSSLRLTNLRPLFYCSSKNLYKHHSLMKKVIELFSKNKIKINIQNKLKHKPPYLIGRGGIFTFDEEEWKLYLDHFKGKLFGISCAQSSVIVDLNTFFNQYQSQDDFRKFIINLGEALFRANSNQRRNSNIYFGNLDKINGINQKTFYRFSRNYIRFWNYDWQEKQQPYILDLLESSNQLLKKLSNTQETIFRSCGMPIRFRIAFSSAFSKFDLQFLSSRKYSKRNIQGIKDLSSSGFQSYVKTREKVMNIFDGGDRFRIFRNGKIDPEEIIHEFNFLLNTYNIPLFSYDFSEMRGDIKLTRFL